MNRNQRQVILYLVNHFSEMSKDMIGLVEELKKPNANEEQCEAFLHYMLEHRNSMVEGFIILKEDIDTALKDINKVCQKQKLKKQI